MAKKTSTKMAGDCIPMEEWSPSVNLDVKSLKDLEDLKVGDSVTIILQGKVRSVEQREDYGSTKVRGSLCLKDYEMKITGPDEWSEMADEDDD